MPLLGSPGPPYSVAPTTLAGAGRPEHDPATGAGRRRTRSRPGEPHWLPVPPNTLVSSASTPAPRPAARIAPTPASDEQAATAVAASVASHHGARLGHLSLTEYLIEIELLQVPLRRVSANCSASRLAAPLTLIGHASHPRR